MDGLNTGAWIPTNAELIEINAHVVVAVVFVVFDFIFGNFLL